MSIVFVRMLMRTKGIHRGLTFKISSMEARNICKFSLACFISVETESYEPYNTDYIVKNHNFFLFWCNLSLCRCWLFTHTISGVIFNRNFIFDYMYRLFITEQFLCISSIHNDMAWHLHLVIHLMCWINALYSNWNHRP